MYCNKNIIYYIQEVEKILELIKDELKKDELTKDELIHFDSYSSLNILQKKSESLYNVFDEADNVFLYYSTYIGFPKSGRKINKGVCIMKIIKFIERYSLSASYVIKASNHIKFTKNITIDKFLGILKENILSNGTKY